MVLSGMPYGEDGGVPLYGGEVHRVDAASRALAQLPTRASVAGVFESIQPCVPVVAGLLSVIRPRALDSMEIHPVCLPPEVSDSWLGTPHKQLVQTLSPVIRSKAGDLWRDSETVTGALREQLDVLRELDAAGLGEGAGYKVLERTIPGQGEEHIMLAMIMTRGQPVPPRAGAMLAALQPAISAAILRIRVPLLGSEPIFSQILTERSTGYICLSQCGTVLAANRRAHELVMRFRNAARVEGGRGAVVEFAARVRELAGAARACRLEAEVPPSLLDVSVHQLAKETHALPADALLVMMNEVLLSRPSRDELLTRAGLTPREKQIALLLADTPASYKEIAADLSRSEGTVANQIRSIYRKLSVRSRPELTARLKK